MESTRKKPRCRRSFTPEFKAEIVELCQRSDRPIGQVANYFDLIQMAVHEWVKRAERDAGTWRDGEPGPMDSKRFTGSATVLFTRPTPPAPRPWARISPRSARRAAPIGSRSLTVHNNGSWRTLPVGEVTLRGDVWLAAALSVAFTMAGLRSAAIPARAAQVPAGDKPFFFGAERRCGKRANPVPYYAS